MEIWLSEKTWMGQEEQKKTEGFKVVEAPVAAESVAYANIRRGGWRMRQGVGFTDKVVDIPSVIR